MCLCVVPAESTAMVGRVDRRVVHLTGPWNALAEATSRNTTFMMMQDGTFNVEVELGLGIRSLRVTLPKVQHGTDS